MQYDLKNVQELIARVSLEVSLKPFWDKSETAIEATCRELFAQWTPLLRKSGRASIMLWLADGGEILEYTGKLEDKFEWAKWIGMSDTRSLDDESDTAYNLHAHAELYRSDAPDYTYCDVKRIVHALKRIGQEITGQPVEVGATFDPGGEFARSDFKFGRHGELSAFRLDGGRFRWVTCTSLLHADNAPYAGFPDGIAEGTHLGTFLGRQTQHFLDDLDMDFIWFSNGFAFAANAWSCTGQLFDGNQFDNANAARLQREILRFWELFRMECPEYRVECRGSNLSTGMDLSAHGSPLKAIYEGGFNMCAPPNSPWAALNGNYGLELVGWMSHIAQLPEGGLYSFRYYIHDPWWLNSPWFDRYGRAPHDIYLPLALARFDKQGTVTRPSCINFLSADTSLGQMPDRCPIDMITHLVRALDDFPDAPGLVTWVYPFDEYYELVAQNRLGEAFFGDWFVTGAVNRGLPLSGVVSSRSLGQCAERFAGAVLFAPVPGADSAFESALISAAQTGARLMLYGPTTHASSAMLAAIGVESAEPLTGELKLNCALALDSTASAPATRLAHQPVYSAGGIDTLALPGTVCLATAMDERGTERAYATFNPNAFDGVGVIWVRGSFNYELRPRLPEPYMPSDYFPSDAIPRLALEKFGISMLVSARDVNAHTPLVIGAKHDNGWLLSGYMPTTNAALALKMPMGAPLLVGTETELEAEHALYHMPRAWHHECRVFVSEQRCGELSCVESFPLHPTYRRRIIVRGLENATVTMLPEQLGAARLHVYNFESDGHMPRESMPYTVNADGSCTLVSVTGTINISW